MSWNAMTSAEVCDIVDVWATAPWPMSEGEAQRLSFDITDTIRDVTPASTEFLGDRFTLAVREGGARWGKPMMRSDARARSARWDLVGGCRVTISYLPRGVTVRFETPQGAEVERKLGIR